MFTYKCAVRTVRVRDTVLSGRTGTYSDGAPRPWRLGGRPSRGARRHHTCMRGEVARHAGYCNTDVDSAVQCSPTVRYKGFWFGLVWLFTGDPFRSGCRTTPTTPRPTRQPSQSKKARYCQRARAPHHKALHTGSQQVAWQISGRVIQSWHPDSSRHQRTTKGIEA